MIELKNIIAGVKINDGEEIKNIINDVSVKVPDGALHVLMGPNGAGKSSIGLVLAGHPNYVLKSGSILLNNEDITKLSPEDRAKKGLFLAFQHPVEIPGVTLGQFLFAIYKQQNPSATPIHFRKELQTVLAVLELSESFVERQLNAGMSGGEKKRAEVLQLLMFKPKVAVLDETDSGLDIDSLRIVSKAVNTLRSKDFSCLLITHYTRILQYLSPDAVHVLVEGKIVKSGSAELASELESKGYDFVKPEVAV